MLKKLYIHNFKSFYNSTFEFSKLNCLIAPNNTGKSNLIEAIEFIDNVLFKLDAEKITFKKNFRYQEENSLFRAEFSFRNRVLVYKELIDYKCNIIFNISMGEVNTIDVDIDGFMKFVDVLEEDKRVGFFNHFRLRSYGDELKSSLLDYEKYDMLLGAKKYSKFHFKYNHSSLNYELESTKSHRNALISLLGMHLDSKDNLTRPIEFKHIFSRGSIFESHYFHSYLMKEKQIMPETSTLDKYGTNLISFISGLNAETIEDISTSLIGEVEQVNGIEISDEAHKRLYFIEDTYKVPLEEASDGTVHFIAIMSAILGNKNTLALLIEEPERHMHMKVLSTIIETMRDDDKQIFFTTHSMEILQELNLDEILFLYRDYDGNTQGKRAKDIHNIKKIMKIYKDDLIEILKIGILDDLNLEEEA